MAPRRGLGLYLLLAIVTNTSPTDSAIINMINRTP